MSLKTSNETALCSGMMMVVNDGGWRGEVIGDGGGDGGMMCFLWRIFASYDSWYRVAVGFCFRDNQKCISTFSFFL